MKKRVLYIGEGVTLSHLVRPLELAERQCRIGNSDEIVHFACDERYYDFIVSKNWKYHKIHTMSQDTFFKRLNSGQVVFDYEYLSNCMNEDEALIEEINPHVIYSDFRLSMYICARRHKITYYAITNAYWSQYSLIERPVKWINKKMVLNACNMQFSKKNYVRYVGRFLRDYNYIRIENGMPIVESIEELYCAGDYTLFSDIPELAPVSNLMPNESYIKPLTGKIEYFKTKETEEALKKIQKIKNASNDCLVYLSMGTSGDYSVLSELLKILSGFNVNVFLTIANNVVIDLPDNVYCYSYLYIDAIMPYMDVAITNGSSGSVYQAYLNGVKIIAIPTNVDQVLACSKIEEQDLGYIIDKDVYNRYSIFEDIIAQVISNI